MKIVLALSAVAVGGSSPLCSEPIAYTGKPLPTVSWCVDQSRQYVKLEGDGCHYELDIQLRPTVNSEEIRNALKETNRKDRPDDICNPTPREKGQTKSVVAELSQDKLKVTCKRQKNNVLGQLSRHAAVGGLALVGTFTQTNPIGHIGWRKNSALALAVGAASKETKICASVLEKKWALDRLGENSVKTTKCDEPASSVWEESKFETFKTCPVDHVVELTDVAYQCYVTLMNMPESDQSKSRVTQTFPRPPENNSPVDPMEAMDIRAYKEPRAFCLTRMGEAVKETATVSKTLFVYTVDGGLWFTLFCFDNGLFGSYRFPKGRRFASGFERQVCADLAARRLKLIEVPEPVAPAPLVDQALSPATTNVVEDNADHKSHMEGVHAATLEALEVAPPAISTVDTNLPAGADSKDISSEQSFIAEPNCTWSTADAGFDPQDLLGKIKVHICVDQGWIGLRLSGHAVRLHKITKLDQVLPGLMQRLLVKLDGALKEVHSTKLLSPFFLHPKTKVIAKQRDGWYHCSIGAKNEPLASFNISGLEDPEHVNTPNDVCFVLIGARKRLEELHRWESTPGCGPMVKKNDEVHYIACSDGSVELAVETYGDGFHCGIHIAAFKGDVASVLQGMDEKGLLTSSLCFPGDLEDSPSSLTVVESDHSSVSCLDNSEEFAVVQYRQGQNQLEEYGQMVCNKLYHAIHIN